jgi:branched-chain amino acid transport system substrate-binding protein
MIRRKQLAVPLAIAAVGALIAACSSSGNNSGGGSPGGSGPGTAALNILSIQAQSGPLAAFEAQAVPLEKAVVAYVDQHGGTGGRQIKIQFLDDGGDPATAVSNLQAYLSSHGKPDLVLENDISQQAMPVLPILTQAKIPVIASVADPSITDTAKYPYAINLAPSGADIFGSLVKYLAGKGYKNVAFIGPDNDSARTFAGVLKSTVAKAGMTISTDFMDPTSVDATSDLTKLQSGHPSALIIDGFGPTAGVFLKSRTKLGWTIPTICDNACAANNLGAISSKPDWLNVKVQSVDYAVKGTPATTSPAFKTLSHIVEQNNLLTGSSLGYAALVSDSNFVILASAGLEKAGSTDPDKVKAALESIKTVSDIPADLAKSWISYPDPNLSATNHQASVGIDDFVFVPAGPVVDGLITPAS